MVCCAVVLKLLSAIPPEVRKKIVRQLPSLRATLQKDPPHCSFSIAIQRVAYCSTVCSKSGCSREIGADIFSQVHVFEQTQKSIDPSHGELLAFGVYHDDFCSPLQKRKFGFVSLSNLDNCFTLRFAWPIHCGQPMWQILANPFLQSGVSKFLFLTGDLSVGVDDSPRTKRTHLRSWRIKRERERET